LPRGSNKQIRLPHERAKAVFKARLGQDSGLALLCKPDNAKGIVVRVLALVTDAFGGYGGIAQFNRDFISGLAMSGHVSEVVILPRIGSADSSDIPRKVSQLAPINNKARYSIAACCAATRHGPFDLIFCGHINAAPLGWTLGRVLKVPVWLQTHGVDAWERPSWLTRAAAERSALITTVSRYTRRRMLQWARIDPGCVRILPNTVRPMFSPGPASRPFLIRHGFEGKKIILTVSRIAKTDKYKGHHKVIEALATVRAEYPEIIYVVAGDGDGRADLEQLVNALDLRSCVKFLGRVSDEDVLELYRAASAFIMPSTKEGFGIVFAEAAAAGVHVIGGNQDGSVDALADGIIGRLIDPRSVTEIAKALLDDLAGRALGNASEIKRFSLFNFRTHVGELVQTFVN
jgi:phosphatidyl-myo-inositol dimannoside synthase